MGDNQRQRVFLAFPLSQSVLQGIRRFRDDNVHLQQSGFRWIAEQNLHITVFYLGPVLLRDMGSVSERLPAVVGNKGPMTLLFHKFSFQPSNKPRMVWAQFFSDQRFSALVHGVADVCKPYLLERSKHYSQPIPHITIARMKHFNSSVYLNTKVALPGFRPWQAQLWLSEPTPRGAVYTPIATFALDKDCDV